MSRHDHAYRSLFGHPSMVADLLRGIVRQDWIAGLDLSTLERVNGEHVAGLRQRRSSDMVWRAKQYERPSHLYVLLEFQSRSDAHMALRILTYLSLLYEDIKRQGKLLPRGRLPAAVPIVIYNGLPRWRSARQVAELIEPVSGLQEHVPTLRYLLLDQGALLARGDLPAGNLATLLFRLEHARSEDELRQALQGLIGRLHGPAFEDLQRTFVAWLRDVLLPARAPGVSISAITTLHEPEAMIVEEKIDWSLRWKQQGLQEGRQQGLREGRREGHQEGRREGESLLLRRQLVRRFGALPKQVDRRLTQAGSEELQAWAMNVLDARTLEEVFRGASHVQ
ncbi:Rpn family recombination-promoting nuclease/putative transposase [Orrella sp. JC864]|uniref:Rpn family recombination-promoting nuclease/putative transposase n=1 Tax=Orrella sp. JC864 TaxID=3120298 RepID=UPI003009316E